MNKFHWSLLILYLTAAAAYGGWRGPDLWSGWGVWCLLLPPFAVAAVKTIADGRRNPYAVPIAINLLRTILAVVSIGGPAVLLAWLVADATGRWSVEPIVRAMIGLALGAGGGGLALLAARSRKAAEQPEASGTREL